jgi:hypothetical protein
MTDETSMPMPETLRPAMQELWEATMYVVYDRNGRPRPRPGVASDRAIAIGRRLYEMAEISVNRSGGLGLPNPSDTAVLRAVAPTADLSADDLVAAVARLTAERAGRPWTAAEPSERAREAARWLLNLKATQTLAFIANALREIDEVAGGSGLDPLDVASAATRRSHLIEREDCRCRTCVAYSERRASIGEELALEALRAKFGDIDGMSHGANRPRGRGRQRGRGQPPARAYSGRGSGGNERKTAKPR